jgi:hypothetical protein
MQYKVRLFQNEIYEVIDSEEQTVYQGRLADCEAFIRLHESGLCTYYN